MTSTADQSNLIKGLVWNEIPNGSYWVAPISDKVFGASDQPEMCRIFGDVDQRWIDHDGEIQEFNDLWEEFVFVPCARPRLEDIDVSAGLAALKEGSDD